MCQNRGCPTKLGGGTPQNRGGAGAKKEAPGVPKTYKGIGRLGQRFRFRQEGYGDNKEVSVSPEAVHALLGKAGPGLQKALESIWRTKP